MGKKRAVIIGAGPAGLTAAYELLKRSRDRFDVVIVEQDAVVGGMAKSYLHNKKILDTGGHRFFTRNDHTLSWIQNMIECQSENSSGNILPDPEKTDNIMLLKKRSSAIVYSGGELSPYPLKNKVKKSFRQNNAKVVKIKNLEDFYISKFGKDTYEDIYEKYTERVFGTHPAELSVSLGYEMLDIKTENKANFQRLVNRITKKTEDINDTFFYPKYGPGQFWDTVAGKIIELGGDIVTNCSVEAVRCGGRRALAVRCQTPDNEKFEINADVFISSMPLRELVGKMEGVGISTDVLRITSGLRTRSHITVGIETRNLNAGKGVLDEQWLYVGEEDNRVGRIQIYDNWSPYMVNKRNAGIWIGAEIFCYEGNKYWNFEDNTLINFTIKELERLDLLSRRDVIDACCIRTKNAYPVYAQTYDEIGHVIRYLDDFSNLFCVGRAGQHRYYTMEQAMHSSIEAVSNILTGRGDRSNIWSVK